MEAEQPTTVHTAHDADHATPASYVVGFASSIVLTLAAYTLVEIHVNSRHETFTHPFLIAAVIAAALVQFLVQLYFFLYLGRETRPRWKLLVLSFMLLVVLILVFGSLWIMHNLNYRMTPQQMNQYMLNQNGGL